jgi:hypothetical protein
MAGLRRTTKCLSNSNWCSDRDLNLAHPQYKSESLADWSVVKNETDALYGGHIWPTGCDPGQRLNLSKYVSKIYHERLLVKVVR